MWLFMLLINCAIVIISQAHLQSGYTNGYHYGHPAPVPYHNVGYHPHVVPVGSATNYAYPATSTTNQIAHPIYHSHGYTQPIVSTARYGYGGHGHYGHGHGHGYPHSSYHNRCRTTYGTWSAWGTCSSVHVLASNPATPCGRGRQVRHRQRNQLTTVSHVTYYRVPYIRYPTCAASCAPAKELFQVQECTIASHVSCVEAINTMPLCDFDNAASVANPICDTAVAGQPTFLYKFTMTTNGVANDYLQLGGSTGTLPLAAYWPTVVFPPSDNYKYCVKYKAKLDEGTMLFAGYLSIPTTIPSADQLAVLCANALLAADNYVSGGRCEGEGVFKCNIGTSSTTALTSYQQEITVKDAFGIGLIMIPSKVSTGLGYSSGQIDDVQVVPGGC